MKKRPFSITVIGWIFVAAGGIMLAAGLWPMPQRTAEFQEHPVEFWLALFIQMSAVLFGAFLLYGLNWARWLLVVWMGYHIVLSVFHTPFKLAVHCLLFGTVLYFLFRTPSSEYFRSV